MPEGYTQDHRSSIYFIIVNQILAVFEAIVERQSLTSCAIQRHRLRQDIQLAFFKELFSNHKHLSVNLIPTEQLRLHPGKVNIGQ